MRSEHYVEEYVVYGVRIMYTLKSFQRKRFDTTIFLRTVETIITRNEV